MRDYTGAGKWAHSEIWDVCYSDPKCESYKKAAEFLGNTVEDWGGGTGWARRYFEDYRNVDGSYHENVDELVDLVDYTSDVENILMRQVLETNVDWKIILENVKKSFRNKFCLVVGTPFVKKTRFGPQNPVVTSTGVVLEGEYVQEVYFNKQDILDMFPEDEYEISEEEVETGQYYHKDWILYVKKI